MLTNLHTHCTFCDGKSMVEEVVLSAIDKGFAALGFSSHGFTDFAQSFCQYISARKPDISSDISI